jgi:hypothetical protein
MSSLATSAFGTLRALHVFATLSSSRPRPYPVGLDKAFAEFGVETLLRSAFARLRPAWDYVVIDCPPSLGLLAIAAFVARVSRCSSVSRPVRPQLIPVGLYNGDADLLAQSLDAIQRTASQILQTISLRWPDNEAISLRSGCDQARLAQPAKLVHRERSHCRSPTVSGIALSDSGRTRRDVGKTRMGEDTRGPRGTSLAGGAG